MHIINASKERIMKRSFAEKKKNRGEKCVYTSNKGKQRDHH